MALGEIQLTRGKVALVDDSDFAELSKFKWHAKPAGQKRSNWYAYRSEVSPDGVTRTVYMHRAVLSAGAGEEVDHRDRDGLNNRRDNLRLCTRAMNCANSAHAIGASGYRGVYLLKDRGVWSAQTSIDNKTVNIGRFDDAEKAARARDAFVLKIHGAFAILNFPIETQASA